MADEVTADVVVIGAGVAGLVTATRATQLGLRVLVIERGIDDDYMCNSRLTGGVFHIGMDSILKDPNDARAFIEGVTKGCARPDLAAALANNGRRVVDWLRTQGVRFIKGPTPDMDALLSPPKLAQLGLHWRGRAGDVLLHTLAERISERGGSILRGVTARELVMKDGRCIGVKAERDGRAVELRADSVVIADGGFQANLELVGRYISPAPQRLHQRNALTGRGDGLLMAEQVGAALVGLDRFYGHVLHRSALENENLWPYPMVDMIAVAAIAVDGKGKRFADEGLGGIYLANEMARLDDPLSVTVIFDEAIWNGPARDWVLPPNPNLEKAGGELAHAGSLAELASAIAVPGEQLAETVAAYNAAIDQGHLGKLSPRRSTDKFQAFPIRTPPFRAVPVCSGITYTMGGIAIDGQARVLMKDGTVIGGLFAAGAATGGLEGGPHAGYTGGLSKAAVFGLLAAESIASAKSGTETRQLV
jgi:fumarate reductase flavoprotein subunit